MCPLPLSLDGEVLIQDADYSYDTNLKKLILRTTEYTEGTYHVSMPTL